MVDSLPGLPGIVPVRYGYRGDPYAQIFQFVGEDTTDWIVNAQVRRSPSSAAILATFTIETNFEGDPELVRISLDEDETAALPARVNVADLERRETEDGPLRTLLKWDFDIDPDVTRVEEGS